MAKPPKIDAEQLGATIDALATTNGMLFTLLASEREREVALQLLGRLASMADTGDPLHELRASVAQATMSAIVGLQGFVRVNSPAENESI